ncbi:uncharacterized protein MONBRDRAFT_22459 [Monosiga brevicollis MX1]|uniref:IPT/TIG domain-containing protein n=1 Tax=Monosiga brevicollis TaxID=81824 RepID=A9UQM8_MONBE|nr:uncharacterized protein MONBRDRAFT_22459 [Monosiga brevicollis MX1]EDQ93072.1 predicted protein [Monosiga brevicollis MX1]|eukprot:XP_001742834.1 hypothetical protein [Monosiga brevicollis MX1]
MEQRRLLFALLSLLWLLEAAGNACSPSLCADDADQVCLQLVAGNASSCLCAASYSNASDASNYTPILVGVGVVALCLLLVLLFIILHRRPRATPSSQRRARQDAQNDFDNDWQAWPSTPKLKRATSQRTSCTWLLPQERSPMTEGLDNTVTTELTVAEEEGTPFFDGNDQPHLGREGRSENPLARIMLNWSSHEQKPTNIPGPLDTISRSSFSVSLCGDDDAQVGNDVDAHALWLDSISQTSLPLATLEPPVADQTDLDFDIDIDAVDSEDELLMLEARRELGELTVRLQQQAQQVPMPTTFNPMASGFHPFAIASPLADNPSRSRPRPPPGETITVFGNTFTWL